ncbi:MAG: septation protein A [Gammaproteobacteria bacterium]
MKKFLFDFFPVLLFFAGYKLYDIYVATAVAIVASVLQVALYGFKYRKVETVHIVTLLLIGIFGGLTLYLQDETFIKWKPTILNWLFGVAFLASHIIGGQPITQRMMGATISLPNRIWINLNIGWTIFFVSLGFINLYVIYNYDTDTWVNFKSFGLMGLMFAFVIAQSLYLAPHIKTTENEK